MAEYDFQKIQGSLAQIAEAMERLSPAPIKYPDFANKIVEFSENNFLEVPQ